MPAEANNGVDSRGQPHGKLHAIVVFKVRTPVHPTDSTLSKVKAGQLLATRNRDQVIEWLNANVLMSDVSSYSEATSLGTFELRGTRKASQALKNHPLVDRVVAD